MKQGKDARPHRYVVMLAPDRVDTSVVPGILSIAALYQSDTRLLVAVATFVLFLAVVPRPAPRPLAVVSLGAIVAIWDFGATLIWGTGGSTKVRFAFALTGTIGGWAVLAAAVVGTVAAAGALRAFARREQALALTLAGTFLVCFAFWSVVVRYSPIIAVIGVLVSASGFRWAANVAPGEQNTGLGRHPAIPRGGTTLILPACVLLPIASGFLFYACLSWGPKSWADPECGATLVIPAFIAAIGLSAVGGGFTSRIAGRRNEVVVATALLTALLAGAVCVFAFLLWFGQNQCGE